MNEALKIALYIFLHLASETIFFLSFADLEAEILHSVIPPPPVIKIPAPSLPTSILSKISTTSENRIPENVSNVLKQLPDFSYLRKSILAFPVLEQTE